MRNPATTRIGDINYSLAFLFVIFFTVWSVESFHKRIGKLLNMSFALYKTFDSFVRGIDRNVRLYSLKTLFILY